MSLLPQLQAMQGLFSQCAACNRAILEALDQGTAPRALADLFQRKEALLGQLGALSALPERAGTESPELLQALDQVTQAQASAIRSEALISAALLPHIPYNGKRINPYQQAAPESPKSALEREG
ncbi:MAG TPA: hypothetical protein VK842_03295 [bacterium]|jgi:hypothetical protein|nr:hypothetical protein [bacterium]